VITGNPQRLSYCRSAYIAPPQDAYKLYTRLLKDSEAQSNGNAQLHTADNCATQHVQPNSASYNSSSTLEHTRTPALALASGGTL
jgi:hypothetical protein